MYYQVTGSRVGKRVVKESLSNAARFLELMWIVSS